MDRPTVLWLVAQLAGVYSLVSSHETTSAYYRPYHSALAILSVTGLVLLLATRLLPGIFAIAAVEETQSSLPLADVPKPHPSRMGQRQGSVGHLRYSRLQQRLVLAVLPGLICLRIEFARQIISNAQCAGPTYAMLLPFLIVAHDKLHRRNALARPATYARPTNPIVDMLYRTTQGSWSLILPAACLTYWSLTLVNATTVRSTYICAGSLRFHVLIPALQLVGTLLDFVIIILTASVILKDQRSHNFDSKITTRTIATVMLGSSAMILFIIGPVAYHVNPDWRYWITHVDVLFKSDAFKLTIAASVVIISTLQLAFRCGVAITTSIIFFSWIYCSAGSNVMTHSQSFPSDVPIAVSLMALGLTGLFLDIWSKAKVTSLVEVFAAPDFLSQNKIILALTLLLLVLEGLMGFSSQTQLSTHPIQSLMIKAKDDHKLWAIQASTSKSVTEAAANYRKRYGRDPPPHFDRWYSYATLHESHVIDDFDNIHHDLLPFWSLTPAEIRLRTWEAYTNPWNGVGGMIIRNGRADVAPNVPGTHRWMIDGIVHMVDKFARWLPDMDLAFNLNDECRVAVAFAELDRMRKTAITSSSSHKPNEFGKSRAQEWKAIPQEPLQGTRFEEMSLHRTWENFGISGCPSFSPAKSHRHWDLSTQCATCTYPHTLNSFLSNWTLSADPCHQPDLGDLHGIHLSPAAYKASKQLTPIFSQSKARGYNDILYPSAWNYEEKAAYSPTSEFPDFNFAEKESTFFWRGATSEGVSRGTGVWRGMTRQRLVHLFNNATNKDKQYVLLPTHPTSNPTQPHTYSFQHLPPSRLRAQISTSLGFISSIERCGGRDCADQLAEFQPQTFAPVNFQQHWRYKYLFDLDGAGFSGRFLPFLRSRSLPLKAGLMREWWEGRVFAWQHFVPLDLRLGEVWSVAAFFAGWKDAKGAAHHAVDDQGRDRGGWLMPPHDEEAEAIALQGREWAELVLRKEDMEVYMFRLLLEFGRLTDDARDRIGYQEDLV